MRQILTAGVLSTLFAYTFAQSSTAAIPTYAPVPSAAVGPAIPSSTGYRVEAFGGGAYMITDGIYQHMFLVTNDSVIVVDAPPTIGHNILRGIRNVTDLPISHLIYSHAHADHIGGAYLLIDQETTIIAHQETVTELGPAIDNSRPLPNITFTKHYDLNVANQSLQLSYKGSNHEPGNIFIYAPYQKILMIVDIIYPDWVPFANLAESQNIPGWIEAHDQILEYEFDHLVSGHVNRAGVREDVLIQKEYVTDLFNNCAEALRLSAQPPNSTNPLSDSVASAQILAANPGNDWALTSYPEAILVDWCVARTNEKWIGRLGGVDVYGTSNGAVMIESLRIDYGVLGAAGVKES